MARGRWYVTTRERVDVGPYETKAEAERAANHLAAALDGVDEPAVAIALINEFVRRRDAIVDPNSQFRSALLLQGMQPLPSKRRQ